MKQFRSCATRIVAYKIRLFREQFPEVYNGLKTIGTHIKLKADEAQLKLSQFYWKKASS